MRVLLMGPPGAGKGTQAARLAADQNIPMISTGELFRASVRERSELGIQIDAIVASGGYVSDEITNAVVRERLGRPDASTGFVLDGYPRTLDQVDELDRMLVDLGTELQAVIDLVVPDTEVVERLVVRSHELGRSDDSPEIVRRRLAIYHEQTAPLRAQYERRGLVIEVDGMSPPDVVQRHIAAALRTDARALP